MSFLSLGEFLKNQHHEILSSFNLFDCYCFLQKRQKRKYSRSKNRGDGKRNL